MKIKPASKKFSPEGLNAAPQYSFGRITDITADDIRGAGGRAVGFDLDNTAVYDSTYRPLEGAAEWVNNIKAAGLPVMIISNTYPRRAKRLSKLFGVPALYVSKKPSTKAIFKAAEMMGADVKNLVMIGDQLFADVLAANDAGAISFWVRPFMAEKLFAGKYRKIREAEAEFLNKLRVES
ncbi:MAG: YqeG family HAD IIIA-type phosphatase [Oscillospiraceae bacterium]|nr:YqeG family HAD IIIA-type phosphatase [Oscillospiraceae bacterium]